MTRGPAAAQALKRLPAVTGRYATNSPVLHTAYGVNIHLATHLAI
jgi:hypothetical protein